MTDRFLEVPDARIAYDVREGVGPAVVALHGLTSSRAGEDAGGYFDWRATTRRLVRFDARGHGRSTGRPVPDDFRWPVLADDLFALLDAVSPDASVDAIGVSMGVGTLLHAAVREPGRFGRLALVIPPTAWETRPAQADVYEQGARFVDQRGLEAFVRGMAAMPPLPILAEGGWPIPEPDVTEALLPSLFRGAGASDFPDPAAVAALPHRVLLLPWAGDPGHPVSTAERLAELLPEATLEVMRTADDLRGLSARVGSFLG